ncbi:MAG: nucleotidyltransferase domain-containing protein [Tepidanaerobacteraceae bacterium]|jgi:predicted nucleotidyltransferase|nr:nucleotidyltransferase domain-containing protein [Tepidanaerobacteraceae bacterium]
MSLLRFDIMIDHEEIEKIRKEIINKFQPDKIILFGSQAKGIAKLSSDIDLCVIINTDLILKEHDCFTIFP